MKQILGYIMIVLFFVGSICGVTFGILYSNEKKNTTQASSYEEQIVELKENIVELNADLTEITIQLEDKTIQLNSALEQNSQNESLISSLQTQVSDLQTQLEQITQQKTQLENQLAELQEDYLNSYEENYNKGYQAGYEYGLAVGRGEIDSYIQDYISENNYVLKKSFVEETVTDSNMYFIEYGTGSSIKALSEIFDLDPTTSNYKLLFACEDGYQTLDCTNISKTSQQYTVKLDTGSQTSVVTTTRTVDYYTLTFGDLNISICCCEDVEGNSFKEYDPMNITSGGATINCNYILIEGTVSLENGLANLYLVSSAQITE